MSIPSEILETIDRLNQELDSIENEANRGLQVIRGLLPLFSESFVLIQLLSTFNNSLLFRDNSKRRIQMTVDSISPPQVADEVIQSAGEDLGELLGRVLETKMLISRAVQVLEDLS
jgi:predicted transcriptional regulator